MRSFLPAAAAPDCVGDSAQTHSCFILPPCPHRAAPRRQASRGGTPDDQLRAVFGHMGLPYVTDRTFRDILDKVADARGVSLFRLLACDVFVKILEKDQEATHMVVEMGNEDGMDAAGLDEFLEDRDSYANASFVGDTQLSAPMSASRTAANVIKAIMVMNELFAIFDHQGTGIVETSELEAVAEQAGELGSALIEEMFTYIDEQEEEGVDFQGVDRVAFFSHFLHALGIVGDDATDAVCEEAEITPFPGWFAALPPACLGG